MMKEKVTLTKVNNEKFIICYHDYPKTFNHLVNYNNKGIISYRDLSDDHDDIILSNKNEPNDLFFYNWWYSLFMLDFHNNIKDNTVIISYHYDEDINVGMYVIVNKKFYLEYTDTGMDRITFDLLNYKKEKIGRYEGDSFPSHYDLVKWIVTKDNTGYDIVKPSKWILLKQKLLRFIKRR